ncbi:MAG: glycosyltransferase, partial [Oscillospiraceae bacterium]|nr:glycosyltransferase [Oscillospiraceae bacterium]
MNTNDIKYSVLMCVYAGDNPEWFNLAIESMLLQTISADEFVIVKDGPVTKKINEIIDKYCLKFRDLFNIVELKKNMGLGEALRQGVLHCHNEWIVRMDADDYSVPSRVEQQMWAAYKKGADIVGSDVVEFTSIPDRKHQRAIRVFPEKHLDIVK